jgi:D-sedoheptulose 7-phosphate isomerase
MGAGDAQHIAGSFLGALNYDRASFAAIALNTDSSVLTTIGIITVIRSA